MMKEDGKRALVTGGTRGIGLACAIELAGLGYRVVIIGRSEASVESALAKLEGSGHGGLACDLGNAGAFLPALRDRWQGRAPEAIVHAAGGTLGAPSDAAVEEWRRVFELNFFSAVAINNQMLPEMEKRGSGLILHISSSAAAHGRASHPYGAAKAALNRYIVDTGRRVAKSGVTLTGIMPAAVRGLDNTWTRRMESEREHCERVAGGQALGRFQTPEEIAAWARHLCETGGEIFAGCVVNADGNA